MNLSADLPISPLKRISLAVSERTDLVEYRIEEILLRTRLLLRALRVPILVRREASPALRASRASFHERNDGVIRQTPAPSAEIVDDVAETVSSGHRAVLIWGDAV